jgi:hypothetical protein
MPKWKRPTGKARPGKARPATTHDPIVQANRLQDAEVMGLLNALSAGMGYADTDDLTPEQEREYRRIASDLLMWCTHARVQAVLVEMAIRGEVIIRWSETGWMFQRVEGGPGGKEAKVN